MLCAPPRLCEILHESAGMRIIAGTLVAMNGAPPRLAILMRTFLALAVVIGLALWGARCTPQSPPYLQVLRVSLYIVAGFFTALLLAAMVDALLATG